MNEQIKPSCTGVRYRDAFSSLVSRPLPCFSTLHVKNRGLDARLGTCIRLVVEVIHKLTDLTPAGRL